MNGHTYLLTLAAKLSEVVGKTNATLGNLTLGVETNRGPLVLSVDFACLEGAGDPEDPEEDLESDEDFGLNLDAWKDRGIDPNLN